MESHLLQMRGLKQYLLSPETIDQDVASFTDAWIETLVSPVFLHKGSRIFYRCVD